jgi:hypothetical protein
MRCSEFSSRLAVTALVITLFGLSACGANHNSIYRSRTVEHNKPSLTMIDAKQRVILTSPTKASNPNSPLVRMCAEPSPDVFSVFAMSLGAGARFGQSDTKAIEAAANFALATAEQGSTIPRTQTVNMLREMMYRTCERYLNGEITDLEMSVQAVRDQRMMASTLAIEQLTGTITPAPVFIGARSNGESGSSSSDAVVAIAKAQKARSEAAAAYAELEATKPTCNELGALKPEEVKADATKQAKKDKCDAAANKRDETANNVKELVKASSEGGIPVAATTKIVSSVGTASGSRADKESIAAVANAVTEIVAMNYDQDEFLLFCIKQISGDAIDPEIKTTCINYVQAGIGASIEKLRNTEGYINTLSRVKSSLEVKFNRFWPSVVSDNDSSAADSTRLRQRIEIYLASQQIRPFGADVLDEIKSKTKKAEIEKLFNSLVDEIKMGLISQ